MRMIYKQGNIEIWEIQEAHGFDYYVYGVTVSGDPRVCPSKAMAFEVAGGA